MKKILYNEFKSPKVQVKQFHLNGQNLRTINDDKCLVKMIFNASH